MKKTLIAMMLATGLSLALPTVATAAPLTGLQDFSALVEKEGGAVVNISTRQTIHQNTSPFPEELNNDPFFEFFRRFAPPRQQREFQANSLGSGFIISNDGYVLTNAHVVAKADEITVTLIDKREFKARLIGSDARTDVALLKINASGLPTVKLGTPSTLKVGQWVIAIGSPFGFENSVTAGIVSAKGRRLPDESYVPFIQTDVAVNPGNSGGPLFDMNGQVVGINSQIYSRSGGFMGLSFAIPIDVAMQVADELKSKGRVTRGRIGVTIQDLSRELAVSFGLSAPTGALINGVESGGPAERAGLRTGDIILKLNGQSLSSSVDLPRMIGSIRPGTPVQLEIWRNRNSQMLTVTPDEMREVPEGKLAQRSANKSKDEAPAQSLARLGVRVAELSPAQLRESNLKFGLLVRQLTPAASRAGLATGDVIVGVGNDMLDSIDPLLQAIRAGKTGSALALRVWRQGATVFVALPVGEGK